MLSSAPSRASTRRRPLLLAALLLLVAHTLPTPVYAQGTNCDASYLDTCHSVSPLKPCGIGASYQVGGVVTGLQLEDIECLYPEYYQKLADNLFTEGDAASRLSFTALSFDIYYDSLASVGEVPEAESPRCIIDEEWTITTIYPNPLQCDLNGPCDKRGNCETLVSARGSLDEVAYRVRVSADDFFATVSLGTPESSVPFDVAQFLRYKTGIDPNNDNEDNEDVFFYDDVDDDNSYSLGKGAGSTDPISDDDESDFGGPLFWDDDNDNNYSNGGNVGNLANANGDANDNGGSLRDCYTSVGRLMSSIGHNYSPTGDTDYTYACGANNNPGTCESSCTNSLSQCSNRVLNPGVGFVNPADSNPFTPSELFAIYANNMVVPFEAAARFNTGDCDLTADPIRGCPLGPIPFDWATRPQGDDTDDNGVDSDDDDELQDTTKARVVGGDGMWLAIERTALMGQWKVFNRDLTVQRGVGSGENVLSVDLYTILTRARNQTPGGLFSKGTGLVSKGSYTAPTATYCKVKSSKTPLVQATRYVQLTVSPRCDVYVPPSTGSDAYKTTWGSSTSFTPIVGGVLQDNERFRFQSYTRIYPSSTQLNYVGPNGTGGGYQIVFGTNMQEPPTSDLDGLYAVVVCESDTDYSFSDDSLFIAPYRRLEGRGRGLTPLDEGRAITDQEKRGEQLWFTLNEADYATWTGTCDSTGPAGNTYFNTIGRDYFTVDTASVGYTAAGLQSTDFPNASAKYNTGASTTMTWKLSDTAVNLNPLFSGGDQGAMCRPYNTLDGLGADTFTPSPSYAAAVMAAWKASSEGVSAAQDTPADEANDQYINSPAGRFTPAGFRISPSVSQWVTINGPNKKFYLGTEPKEPYTDPLTGDSIDVSNDPEGLRQPTFRFTYFLTQEQVSFGGTIVGVDDFTVEGQNSINAIVTTLCPPLVPGNCDASAPLPTDYTTARSLCGYTAIYVNLAQTARVNAGVEVRFNFDECLAQGFAPFCVPNGDANNYCQEIVDGSTACTTDCDGSIAGTSDSASITNLQSTNNVVFFRSTGADGGNATVPDCTSTCPIAFEERVGDQWIPLSVATIPNCHSEPFAATVGCAGSASPSGTRTPSMTPTVSDTPTPSPTPSSTPSPGSPPSSTSTASETSTGTSTRTATPSATKTTLPSRSAGAELASQTKSPSPLLGVPAGVSSSPTPRASASTTQTAYYDYYSQSNDTCAILEIGCNCGADFTSFDCFLDIGLLAALVAAFLAALALVAYLIAVLVREKQKKSQDEQIAGVTF